LSLDKGEPKGYIGLIGKKEKQKMAKKPTNLEVLQKHLYDYAIPFMAYAMKMEAENHPDFTDMYTAVISWKARIFPYLGKSRVTSAALAESNTYIARMRNITRIYKFGDPTVASTEVPPAEYMKRARLEFGREEVVPAKYKLGDKVGTPAGPGVVDCLWVITETVICSLNTTYRVEYNVKLDNGQVRAFSEDKLSEINQ
jgi:hypothetical protein